MSIESILAYFSVGISIASGISSALIWVRYLQSGKSIVKSIWKSEEENEEGGLYIIGVSGRF